MTGVAEQEPPGGGVFHRSRRNPFPGGPPPFDDCAVDVGWYDKHEVNGGRVFLERFGWIPEPPTLSEFIRTVQQIASAANGQIYGWRGQSNGYWAVHSGAMRRVRQPWVQPFPTDRQRIQNLIAPMRKQLGIKDARRHETREDDDPQLWWDMLTYHAYLLNEARLRGFDHHDGVKLCDLELLALLQHHGAATHLLDISKDVTIALWFASCADSEHTGVVVGFDDTGIQPLTAEAAAVTQFRELMELMQYPPEPHNKLKPAVGWIPRNLTQRILAQRGLFILSAYADQPWGSVQIASTYVWQRDIERGLDPNEPRVFFIAVTPELKKEVLDAGKSGLLGVDPTSLFPDIVGFATANDCRQDVPLPP
jgi:FRG domain